ncbi:hypothetical protein OTU49_013794, partial [Cherax quadricarinatus]
MMKERAWVRSWLSGFLLVVVLGHVQAQDNVEQLNITSFTLDTTSPTMTVKVCFTDTADSDLGNLDTNLVTLTCGGIADDPNEVILNSSTIDIVNAPNYCSTHKFAKPFNAYGATVYCVLDATNKTVEDSPPRSGSAEFEIPAEDAFTQSSVAYILVGQKLLGVVRLQVGSFDIVKLNSEATCLEKKASTNIIYISYTGTVSTVSFCKNESNTAAGHSDSLDICSPAITEITTATDFDTKASELTYTDSGATLTVTFPGTGTYDLVVMKGDSIENVDTAEIEPTDTATTNIDIYNKGDGIHFLAVKKDDNSLTKADVTITDYNLRVMALTSYTLEMVWENKENANLFKIERTSTDETDTSFKTAHVNCTGLGSCFGYFVELIPDTEYTCSVSQNDESFKITHQAVSTMPMTTGFSVRQLTLKWNSELNSADTSVCFDQEDATASDVSSYLELIMINSQGKILKSRRTTQTMQGILCFENILIETSTFSLSEGKVNVVVLNRDVNSHTVLTSGEAELFLISPEIKAVGARGGHISWDNPGGYSITTMMEGHSTHLGATTTGRLRHYFFP